MENFQIKRENMIKKFLFYLYIIFRLLFMKNIVEIMIKMLLMMMHINIKKTLDLDIVVNVDNVDNVMVQIIVNVLIMMIHLIKDNLTDIVV